MPLPTLVVPEYECTLPFGQKVTYRPFLVREEKLLYMAMESQDQKEMIKAVKDIIKKGPISVEKDLLAVKSLKIMNDKKITSLCVHSKTKKNKTNYSHRHSVG